MNVFEIEDIRTQLQEWSDATKILPAAEVTNLIDNTQLPFGGGGNKNDAWSLNLNTYGWEELTTTGTKPSKRFGHSSIAYNGKMVMFGGTDACLLYTSDAADE